METKNKRATVYLDPKLHRALKIKSAQIERTMSDLINDAVRISLSEDYDDMLAVEARQNEPDLDFKDILKEVKDSGKL
jgi:hypothetical protein